MPFSKSAKAEVCISALAKDSLSRYCYFSKGGDFYSH